MAKNKSSLNWYLLIAGILVLYSGLSNKTSQSSSRLRMITVELSEDIINIKGRRTSSDYKFWANKYPNQFNILNGSISRGKREPISNLKKGQEIQIWISEKAYVSLGKENTKIAVRGISLNGKSLMSQNEYLKNRKMYKMRLKVIAIFTGIMLLINGLDLVSSKANYLIIFTFLGAIILMKIFDFGLY
jgi:hypothetical protein